MTPAINIQAMPVPVLWLDTFPIGTRITEEGEMRITEEGERRVIEEE